PVLSTAPPPPSRILAPGDPSPEQLAASVRAIAERLGDGSPRHHFAFQSAALTSEAWLGPDVSAVLARLADQGERHVVVAPIGFTCEHVEVLYDIDVELRRQAAARGVHLERAGMVNADEQMMAGLADLIIDAARREGWS